MTRIRNIPTAEGANAIRSALANQGIRARVAKQRYAYRVVSDDNSTLPALLALGLQGPTGGEPVAMSGGQFFAYEFA